MMGAMARDPEPYVLPAVSTELIQVPISAKDDANAAIDLTGFDVYLAFMPRGEAPATGDLHQGSWSEPSGKRAQLLVGPAGGVEYEAGTYVAWWWVDYDAEDPIRKAPGGLKIVEA